MATTFGQPAAKRASARHIRRLGRYGLRHPLTREAQALVADIVCGPMRKDIHDHPTWSHAVAYGPCDIEDDPTRDMEHEEDSQYSDAA